MDIRVRKGMIVRSTSGISLGKVVAAGPTFFVVERGLFFPKDHELNYGGIADIKENEITYRLAQDAVPVSTEARTLEGDELKDAKAEEECWTTTELEEGKELHVSLMEEEVVVEKATKETGSVRIHKNVVVETRQVTVPIKREEVIVERHPAAKTAPMPANAHPFEDERFAIPVHEESIEVIKRPILKEEVTVRRVTREEQRAASADVRHEELEVEDTSRRAMGMEGDYSKDKKEV